MNINSFILCAWMYRNLGFSVVAIGINKRCFHYWKHLQRKPMSDFKILKTFSDPKTNGIAIICGEISHNLEVIDLDAKNDLTGNLKDRFNLMLKTQYPELYNRLVIADTKNMGQHFMYRCKGQVGRSKAVARRYSTPLELKSDPANKIRMLIEIRAEKSYVIVAPSLGYQFIQNNLATIPTITEDEKKNIYSIVELFNEVKRKETQYPTHTKTSFSLEQPLDDYDFRGDVISLLQSHGWIIVGRDSEKTIFLRPGNTDHEKSGDFHHGMRMFTVFTTNSDFEPYIGYRPCAVFAFLECNKNFILAAKRLLDMGYGKRYKDR